MATVKTRWEHVISSETSTIISIGPGLNYGTNNLPESDDGVDMGQAKTPWGLRRSLLLYCAVAILTSHKLDQILSSANPFEFIEHHHKSFESSVGVEYIIHIDLVLLHGALVIRYYYASKLPCPASLLNAKRT